MESVLSYLRRWKHYASVLEWCLLSWNCFWRLLICSVYPFLLPCESLWKCLRCMVSQPMIDMAVFSTHKWSLRASKAHKFKKKKCSSLPVPIRSEGALWNREELSVPVALADYSEFTSPNSVIILGLRNSVPIMNSSVSKIDGSLIKCSRHMPIYSRIHTECSVLKNHSFPRVSNCYLLYTCFLTEWEESISVP